MRSRKTAHASHLRECTAPALFRCSSLRRLRGARHLFQRLRASALEPAVALKKGSRARPGTRRHYARTCKRQKTASQTSVPRCVSISGGRLDLFYSWRAEKNFRLTCPANLTSFGEQLTGACLLARSTARSTRNCKTGKKSRHSLSHQTRLSARASCR